MAKDAAQIRAQIGDVRARLEEDLDKFEPIVSRRLHRARRFVQVVTIVLIGLAGARILHRHGRGRPVHAGKNRCAKCHCCKKCRALFRRR